MLSDYEAAWQAKDAAAVAALYAEDGFVLSSGTPPVRGRAAIQAHYAGRGGPLALRALSFATGGSVGYVIGAYARQRGDPDAGKFTLTLHRDTGGRWWIVSDMDNGNTRGGPAGAAGPAAATGPAAAAVAVAPAAADKPDDAATAVRAVMNAQIEAWNRGDLPGYMAGYWQSPDLVFFSNARETRGWQPTLDRYRARYQGAGKQMGTLDFPALDVVTLGPGAAIARGQWRLTMPGGTTQAGLTSVLFRQLPEGWRIVHDHSSADADRPARPRTTPPAPQ